MSDWPSIVSAGAAVAAAIYAKRGIEAQTAIAKEQNDRALLASGLQLLVQQDDEFDSARIRTARDSAARRLRGDSLSNEDDVDDLLDFFERIAFMWRRGALDVGMIHAMFFYWMHYYYVGAEDYITKKQIEASQTWKDFTDLHKELVDFERKRDYSSKELQVTRGSTALTKFLNDEARVTEEPPEIDQ